MKDFAVKIRNHWLEYYDKEHLYLVDGIQVPSITEMLRVRFGEKYADIDPEVLQRAADKGTEVHEAIERYCETGEEADLPELRGFKFLQKHYEFEVLQNEVPVILFRIGEPIAAGRCDLVIQNENGLGGADIKRTSTLDKNYLTAQLNLYREAYYQCYRMEWSFLVGIHLREDLRKFVGVPINENLTWEIVDEWRKMNEQSY